jgi:hypothetical protein
MGRDGTRIPIKLREFPEDFGTRLQGFISHSAPTYFFATGCVRCAGSAFRSRGGAAARALAFQEPDRITELLIYDQDL